MSRQSNLLAISLLVFSAVAAKAAPVTWYFSGVTFSDGATLSGQFDYDSSQSGAAAYSNISIMTTAGSSVTAATFTVLNPGSPGSQSDIQAIFTTSASPAANSPELFLQFSSSLTAGSGTILLVIGPNPPPGGFFATCGDAGCDYDNGDRTAVTSGSVTTTAPPPPGQPDLTATKTDNVGGSTYLGNTFTWTITITNQGNASATFNASDLILTDLLPNGNINYGAVSVPAAMMSGISGTGTIGCVVSSDNLNCQAGGGTVTIAALGSFSVLVQATPTAAGTFTNPRDNVSCRVDPQMKISESDETNNTCGPDSVAVIVAYGIRYVSNLNTGDSVIDITNDGQTAPSADPVLPAASNLCIGVYAFDANEELQSCCSCLVTPDGLASLSAQAINATSLTGENPTSLVVKLLAWSTTAGASSTAPPGTPAPPTSSSCNPATPGILSGGMHAWATTIHALPVGQPNRYTVAETEFAKAALSPEEFAHIALSCEFNQINGSASSGQCKGCVSGGMGAAASQ